MSMPSPAIEAKEKMQDLMVLISSMGRTIDMQDAAAQKAQIIIGRLTLANKKLRAKLKK